VPAQLAHQLPLNDYPNGLGIHPLIAWLRGDDQPNARQDHGRVGFLGGERSVLAPDLRHPGSGIDYLEELWGHAGRKVMIATVDSGDLMPPGLQAGQHERGPAG
jgi:hypothetical protein